jgi:hypothetical protein
MEGCGIQEMQLYYDDAVERVKSTGQSEKHGDMGCRGNSVDLIRSRAGISGKWYTGGDRKHRGR